MKQVHRNKYTYHDHSVPQIEVDDKTNPESWTLLKYLDGKQESRELKNKPDERNFKITGLQSNSFYEIKVTATNEKGDSPVSSKLIKTSAGGELNVLSPLTSYVPIFF